MNETGYYHGSRYRIVRQGRRWALAFWCDCLLGPHWHEQGDYRTKTEARHTAKEALEQGAVG